MRHIRALSVRLCAGLSLALALPLAAQTIITPQVAGTTSTQAVLSYSAPDSNPCTVVVSESPTFSPLVHDVDPALFAGANLDSRQPDLNSGQQRLFVVGRRRADAATDGKLYSRALQVSTQHYYQVTCGSASASGSFTTRDLPLGDLFPENPPFSSAGFGNYAWPTIDWTNRNQSYIDPMSGVLVKLATFPGDWPNKNKATFGTDFWLDNSGHWTNPQNAVAGTAGSLAQYSGAGNEPLFLGIDPAKSVLNIVHGGWGQPNAQPPYSIDDLGVHLIGSGTDSSAANRTVSMCLSLDSGQTCYTNAINVVLPSGSAADSGPQPSTFPSPIFRGWGKAIRRADFPSFPAFGANGATVSISGHAVTLNGELDGSTFFNPEIAAGSKIHITGSSPTCAHNLCTITSIQNGSQLTITESLNLTNATFTFANVGLRIVKTSGTGQISLTGNYEYAFSAGTALPASTGIDLCSHVPVTVSVDRNGTTLPGGQTLTGFSCSLGGVWYWISTTTGEARLISTLNFPPPAAFSTWDTADVPNVFGAPPGIGSFDLTAGNVAYVSAPLQTGSFSLFKVTYTGNYSALNYNYPTGNGFELPKTISDGLVWTNITPASKHLDIQSQIDAKFPAYDKAKFGNVSEFYGISGNYAMFLHTVGGQDSPCWVFLVNVQSGIIEQGFNSWDGTYDPIVRWAGCHSGFSGSVPNTAILATKPAYLSSPGYLYGGPFNSKVVGVYRGGQLSSNASLAPTADGSYDAACPADLDSQWIGLGATGNGCVTIRVQGEPCSAYATAQEAAWSPCPWDGTRSMLQVMLEGDLVTDSNWTPNTGGTNVGPDAERLRLVRKTPVAGGQFDLVLQRNISQYCGQLTAQRTHAQGWSILMAAGGTWTCDGSLVTVDILSHHIYGENRYLIGGHSDYGIGRLPNTSTLVGVAAMPGGGYGYAIRDSKPLSSVGQPADFYVNFDPKFAGIPGITFDLLQTYNLKNQWNASLSDLRWALDFRHLNGSTGIAQESTTLLTANNATLVAGTTNVYRLSTLGAATNVKAIPLLAYAGRYLLKEKSGPATGDTITDADAYRFCYSYNAGECRHDSTAGLTYVSVPHASITGYCQSAQYARNIPCAMTGHPLAAWGLQFDVIHSNPSADAAGSGTRRLTMGFSGPGRQYAFGSLRSLPDGKWAMMSGWWLDGMRQDILLVKLPPFRSTDTATRNTFVPVTVKIGAFGSAVRAAVDFGYAEYGNPSDFYCTPRAEACTALGSSINIATPFVYASEGAGGVSCRTGCTITIPALAARVLYYRIRYSDAAGNTVVAGPVQVLASPEAAGAHI